MSHIRLHSKFNCTKQMGVGAYWSAISLTNDRAPAEQIWVHEGWNS